jgi:acetate kinase
MKIMALNNGGSSIKYELYEIEKEKEISLSRG